jgi:hypothetical protein
MMDECLVKSLGHGVYHIEAPSAERAWSAVEQVGAVLEVWADPERPGMHVAVLRFGYPTSKYEAGIATDPDIAASVRRTAVVAPGSLLRVRLRTVSEACSTILGEAYDRSSLEA